MSHWQPKSNARAKIIPVLQYVVGVHLVVLFVLFCSISQTPLHIGAALPRDARVICLPSYMVPNKQRAEALKKADKKQHKPVKKSEKKKPIDAKKSIKKSIDTGKILPHDRGFSPRKKIEKPAAEREEPAQEPEKKELAAAESVEQSDEVIVVNKETYAALQIASDLQQAVLEHWRPPAGLYTRAACEVKVVVDGAGHAHDVTVIKKSGVPVYDMAARQALRATTYPRAVWKRTLIVHFNEDFACGNG